MTTTGKEGKTMLLDEAQQAADEAKAQRIADRIKTRDPWGIQAIREETAAIRRTIQRFADARELEEKEELQ